MMQRPWFKVFIWFAGTVFFFMASAALISYFGPVPTEAQVMAYMAGMMAAMENSLMGLSMSLEGDSQLKGLIAQIASVTVPLIFVGIGFGVLVRIRRSRID
ncbi:MAG TPA: hypothetical protein VEG39_20260 [Clostridia bacterium]|nr:hypothetical protein [Clostridia bacterium]